MIIKKIWLRSAPSSTLEWHQEGWFLFGILPLYVRDMTPRGRVTR
jgi:hypothetical protein